MKLGELWYNKNKNGVKCDGYEFKQFSKKERLAILY